MAGIPVPEGWDATVVAFAEAPRETYSAIRDARPDQELSRRLLEQFIDSCRLENCVPQKGYISSIGLKP